jgi:hypothetical protein
LERPPRIEKKRMCRSTNNVMTSSEARTSYGKAFSLFVRSRLMETLDQTYQRLHLALRRTLCAAISVSFVREEVCY